MAYKLPKDLKYKEKVVANLTWKETAYLAAGITATGLIATTKLPTIFKILLATPIIIISILLSFTKLESRLKDQYVFHRSLKEAGYLDQKAYNFLEIQEITGNGKIKANDGRKLAFIEIDPVNLKIRTKKEKERILKQYQDFLNSLNFPIHISVRTVDAIQSIEKHFKDFKQKTQETNQKSRKNYYDDYQNFWRQKMKKDGIKKRKYYITVPSTKKEDEEAFKELERRIELIREKLPAQISSRKLGKHETTKMLSSIFGKHIEYENQLYSPITLHEKQRSKQ